MSDNNFASILKDKRGQEGETLTWMPALIAILIILAFSIGISFLMSKAKALNAEDIKIAVDEADSLSQKTSLAHLAAGYRDRIQVDAVLKEESENE